MTEIKIHGTDTTVTVSRDDSNPNEREIDVHELDWNEWHRLIADTSGADSENYIPIYEFVRDISYDYEIPESAALACVELAIDERFLTRKPKRPDRVRSPELVRIELEAGGEIRIPLKE